MGRHWFQEPNTGLSLRRLANVLLEGLYEAHVAFSPFGFDILVVFPVDLTEFFLQVVAVAFVALTEFQNTHEFSMTFRQLSGFFFQLDFQVEEFAAVDRVGG